MSDPPSVRINVDFTNPGHFFACCGLLELADRLWGGAQGAFTGNQFVITGSNDLPKLIQTIAETDLEQLDPDDATASAINVKLPHRPLRLDWWQDTLAGGKELKVWAGTMESCRIAKAMQLTLRDPRFQDANLLNIGTIAYDTTDPSKKVEPFYFDARRGPNAHSRDVGFSPNDLKLTTTAFPAVEFLCLVGLQRCLPTKTNQRNWFEYHTWSLPVPPSLVSLAACGLLVDPDRHGYRFENWYRTGQKKHKAFRSAISLSHGF